MFDEITVQNGFLKERKIIGRKWGSLFFRGDLRCVEYFVGLWETSYNLKNEQPD